MSTLIMSKCWPIQIDPSPKAVLISLADNANDEGVCWPSIDTISMRTCLSERTVKRAIMILEKLGLLVTKRRDGRSNVYKITPDNILKHVTLNTNKGVPPCQGCHSDTGDTVAPEGCHGDTGGVTQWHEGGDTVTPRTVIEPSLNRKEPSLEEIVPKVPKEKLPQNATSLPRDFKPGEKHVQLANELGVNLIQEFEKFCDHARANGKIYKDWSAALNNWIRNSTRFWIGNTQPKNTRVMTPATQEIPPGFLNSSPDYVAPVITQEDIDAMPF